MASTASLQLTVRAGSGPAERALVGFGLAWNGWFARLAAAQEAMDEAVWDLHYAWDCSREEAAERIRTAVQASPERLEDVLWRLRMEASPQRFAVPEMRAPKDPLITELEQRFRDRHRRR